MLFKVAIERGMMITGALTAAAVQWKLVLHRGQQDRALADDSATMHQEHYLPSRRAYTDQKAGYDAWAPAARQLRASCAPAARQLHASRFLCHLLYLD